MTRALVLVLTAALLAAASGALPSPALMPVAIALALVAAGAWLVTAYAARRVIVIRALARTEAREGAPIRIAFTVTGLGRLPVVVEVRDGAGAWLEARALDLVVPRRGAYELAPSALRVRDRFGIASRALTAGTPERLLILPAPDAAAVRAGVVGAAAGDPEPDGLQGYAPGIPISRIHWPSLARGAGLHARRVAASPHELPLVVVDTAGAPGAGAIDWAARAAAGHVLRLVRAGGCRVLLPGDDHPTVVAGPVAWRALHRRLALLAPGAPTRALAGAIRIAAAGAAAPPPAPLPLGVEHVP
jgi:uncharacterized protein (DUF58 family)